MKPVKGGCYHTQCKRLLHSPRFFVKAQGPCHSRLSLYNSTVKEARNVRVHAQRTSWPIKRKEKVKATDLLHSDAECIVKNFHLWQENKCTFHKVLHLCHRHMWELRQAKHCDVSLTLMLRFKMTEIHIEKLFLAGWLAVQDHLAQVRSGKTITDDLTSQASHPDITTLREMRHWKSSESHPEQWRLGLHG